MSSCAAELEKSRISLEELKNSYFGACVRSEKAAKMLKIEDDDQRIALANKNYEAMKNIMIKASENYLTALGHEKELWSEYESSKRYGMDYLKDLEETRLQFLKRCFEKYYQLETKYHSSLSDTNLSLEKAFSQIIPSADASKFQKSLLQFTEIPRQDWVSYEQWKEMMKTKGLNPLTGEENYILSEFNYKPIDSTIALMKHLIYSIIPNRRKMSSDSSSTDRSTLMETPVSETIENESAYDFSKVLMDSEQWDNFISILESRKYIGLVESNSINTLAGLLSTVISLMMDEKLFKLELFCRIVNLSHLFYTFGPRRLYLFSFLDTHPIFQVYSYWVKTLQYSIQTKLLVENNLFKKNQQKLKKMGKKTQTANKNSKKSTIASIISQYNYYMTNLGTPPEISLKVITKCSKDLAIGSERFFPLLSELYSIQPEVTDLLTKHKSLRVNSKLRSKWGLHLYLGLSCDYLGIEEIPALLLVCKTWYTVLSGYYYKQALLSHSNVSFRKKAWGSVLYKPSNKKFIEILAELKSNPGVINELADVIHMDVFRSYASNPYVNSDSLEEILKAYAYYRPKVGYCQGMHYVAGTLTQVLGYGEMSFWGIDEIIRLHHMQDLYGQDMSKLKVFFFVLDRLIALHVPEMRKILNAESIVSSNYSAAWFITLFAGQLSGNNDTLLKIWDFFIFVRLI